MKKMGKKEVEYHGRGSSSTTATGYSKQHEHELKEFLKAAMN